MTARIGHDAYPTVGRRVDLPSTSSGMTGRALLLTPSRGRGGGIERYAETLEWAFADQGVNYRRVDLYRRGVLSHARMLARAREDLRAAKAAPTRLVLAHRSLLPTASLLAREHLVCGISVVCHGSDVWAAGQPVRRGIENRLMRRSDVRIVASSSFTAGALFSDCKATVLAPGLSRGWFDMLVDASTQLSVRNSGVQLVTTFRLGQWRGKGLPELLDAVVAVGRSDIRVTVCGIGEPPQDLQRLVHQHGFCTLRPGVNDRELARELAWADLFVLATRTRGGRHASGEGFGLALLEAQVAGTPVVAPAFGGSRDAYVDRVTGLAPTDETAGSLAKVLDQLLQDPCQLRQMGRRAGEWARESFAPELYASQAVARLL